MPVLDAIGSAAHSAGKPSVAEVSLAALGAGGALADGGGGLDDEDIGVTAASVGGLPAL